MSKVLQYNAPPAAAMHPKCWASSAAVMTQSNSGSPFRKLCGVWVSLPGRPGDTMKTYDLTPAQLAVRLTLYFVVLFGTVATVITVWPESMRSLPLGGHDALDHVEMSGEAPLSQGSASSDEADFEITSTLRAQTSSVKSDDSSLQAIYFNKLPGRPLPNLHHNA